MDGTAAPGGLRSSRTRSALRVDVVVAFGLSVGALVALLTLSYRGPAGVALIGGLAATTAVSYRRVAPALALGAATIGSAVYQRITYDPLGACMTASVVLTAFMFGRRAHGRATGHVVFVGAVAIAAAAVSSATGTAVAAPPFAWIPLVALPAVAGVLVTRRDETTARLAATLASLEEEQALRAAQAAADERHRVARDLHDVVAHGVSVMVIQAGAARLVAGDDAGAARAALAVIEESGRDAMTDLRRLMGVLRRDDEVVDADSGLARLDALVARVRAAGVTATVDVDGRPEPLPPPLDLVAYRVVQEALTNVVKHAGAGARARVHVRFGDDGVDLDITNTPGSYPRAIAGASSGQGLDGMRERVACYRGALDAGATLDGGFRVHARVPRVVPVGTVASAGASAGPPPAAAVRADPRRSWVHDARFDRGIAAAWFVALEVEALTSAHRRGPLMLNLLAVGVMAVAAVWRRRSPLVFLAVVGSIAVVLGGGLTTMSAATIAGTYSLVVPLYTVAAWQSVRRAAFGLGMWSAGSVAGAVLWHAPLGGLAGAVVMGCVIWTAGRVRCGQRRIGDQLATASALLTANRAERERTAVTRERGRIARELQTLVSYDVVSMVVQAEAARGLLEGDPTLAREAIEAIERTGRDALARLREILGVLRAGGRAATPGRDLDGAVA